MNTCWAPHLEMSPKLCFTVVTVPCYVFASKQTHCALVAYCSLTQQVFEYPLKVVYSQCCLVVTITWLVPCETAAVGVCSLYTTQPCTGLHCHFVWSHICMVHHVCLAVTCHLHFWQSDWDHLCATAVTHGWNRYQNESLHRKLNLEIFFILLGLQPVTIWL